MSYKLEKPYTNVEYADFVCAHQGMKSIETDNAFYFLEDYEELQGNEVVDVSDTDEYRTKILTQENAVIKSELQSQIYELDLKRIRALAEGGTMPDGTSYLDFYTNQIKDLRSQVAALNS